MVLFTQSNPMLKALNRWCVYLQVYSYPKYVHGMVRQSWKMLGEASGSMFIVNYSLGQGNHVLQLQTGVPGNYSSENLSISRATLGPLIYIENSWEWYYSPSQEWLLKCENETWTSFCQIHRRNCLPIFDSTGTPSTPPPPLPTDACRVTMYEKGHRYICTGCAPLAHASLEPTLSFCLSF
jgi:hypothetical protein